MRKDARDREQPLKEYRTSDPLLAALHREHPQRAAASAPQPKAQAPKEKPSGREVKLIMPDVPMPLDATRIIKWVAEEFGVEREKITGRRFSRLLVDARFAAAFLIKESFPKRSLQDIGRLLGGRDHTSVLHAIRGAKKRIENRPDYREHIATLRIRIAVALDT